MLVERWRVLHAGGMKQRFGINEFERHLTQFGTVICKFWLHISKRSSSPIQARGHDLPLLQAD